MLKGLEILESLSYVEVQLAKKLQGPGNRSEEETEIEKVNATELAENRAVASPVSQHVELGAESL